jgi:hypothetical protein
MHPRQPPTRATLPASMSGLDEQTLPHFLSAVCWSTAAGLSELHAPYLSRGDATPRTALVACPSFLFGVAAGPPELLFSHRQLRGSSEVMIYISPYSRSHIFATMVTTHPHLNDNYGRGTRDGCRSSNHEILWPYHEQIMLG